MLEPRMSAVPSSSRSLPLGSTRAGQTGRHFRSHSIDVDDRTRQKLKQAVLPRTDPCRKQRFNNLHVGIAHEQSAAPFRRSPVDRPRIPPSLLFHSPCKLPRKGADVSRRGIIGWDLSITARWERRNCV
jgi:hypothetical protein